VCVCSNAKNKCNKIKLLNTLLTAAVSQSNKLKLKRRKGRKSQIQLTCFDTYVRGRFCHFAAFFTFISFSERKNLTIEAFQLRYEACTPLSGVNIDYGNSEMAWPDMKQSEF